MWQRRPARLACDAIARAPPATGRPPPGAEIPLHVHKRQCVRGTEALRRQTVIPTQELSRLPAGWIDPPQVHASPLGHWYLCDLEPANDLP